MAQKENKVERKKRGRPGKTTEELKEDLKKEIIRLGLDSFPSLVEYRKRYIRGKAPSASTVMIRTGKNWEALMIELGFEYNQVKSKYAVMYSESGRKEILNKVISLMKKENCKTSKEMRKIILPQLGVSYTALIKNKLDWRTITTAYEKKYGEKIGRKNYLSKSKLDSLTAVEILTELFEILDKNELTNLEDAWYMKKSYAEKRFGTSDLYKLEKIFKIIK